MEPLLRARVAGQSGLITRQQALDGGFTDRAVRWRLSRGRWLQMHPGVYLTEPGRREWEVRAVAALLHVGAPSALCGPSAGHAWGLVPTAPDAVHVVVPATHRGGDRDGITVVRSRQLAARVHPTAWPHRTSVEHTVFDLAHGGSLDRGVALAARACQQHLTTPGALACALDERPNQTHRGLLAEVLGLVGEAESAAEVRYIRDVERAHGLPRGARQEPGPRSQRRDSEYTELKVIVEVDGRIGHEGWRGRAKDVRRDRDAARSAV